MGGRGKLVRLAYGVGATVGVGACLGAATLGWAYCEARWPVLRRVEMDSRQLIGAPTPSLTSNRACCIRKKAKKRADSRPRGRQLRILHVSDPHMHARSGYITDFLATIAAEVEFDFVVATGDNLSDAESLNLLLEAFAPLLEKPGCFVFGSNDYYAAKAKPWITYLHPHRKRKKKRRREPNLPWAQMANTFVASGWMDLGNRTRLVRVPVSDGSEAVLQLAGVDDPHIRRDYMPDLQALPLRELQPDVFMGVTHAPYQRVLDAFTVAGVELIFAGHTHGGQLRLPGVGALVTNSDIPCRYARGFHEWVAFDETSGCLKSSMLNVSAGLGTSPFAPVRFACRPEATLLTINLPEAGRGRN